MSRNIGTIHRTKRGWRVNRIHFKTKVHKEVKWTCHPNREYMIILPPVPRTLGKHVTVVLSRNGKASFGLGRLHAKPGKVIPYLILLKDGDHFNYVAGNSPPIIIIQ